MNMVAIELPSTHKFVPDGHPVLPSCEVCGLLESVSCHEIIGRMEQVLESVDKQVGRAVEKLGER